MLKLYILINNSLSFPRDYINGETFITYIKKKTKMKYYLSLPINTRICLKDMSSLIGIPFSIACSLFGLKQTLNLIEDKLKIENII